MSPPQPAHVNKKYKNSSRMYFFKIQSQSINLETLWYFLQNNSS